MAADVIWQRNSRWLGNVIRNDAHLRLTMLANNLKKRSGVLKYSFMEEFTKLYGSYNNIIRLAEDRVI
jgi:hypothetical protein